MDDGSIIVSGVNGGSRQMDDLMQLKNGDKLSTPDYTMPGIIHFLQTEWTKIEMERSHWEVERAELQARIAFLQGERKGQENLKQDLVRRIKMLEFALKQERAKYHRFKYGTDPPGSDASIVGVGSKSSTGGIGGTDGEPDSGGEHFDPAEVLAQTRRQVAASNAKWKESRAKLRQYLQEVGYTDNILDVRQARVRQILGVDFDASHQGSGKEGRGGSPNGSDSSGGSSGKRMPSGRANRIAEALSDTEASVLATFDFLGGNVTSGGDDEDGKGIEFDADADAADTEEALAEFDFLVAQQDLSGGGGGRDFAAGSGQNVPAGGGGSGGGGAAAGAGGNATAAAAGNEWNGVSPQLISKLKEQYRQERSGRASATSPGAGGPSTAVGGRRAGPTSGGLQHMLAGLAGPDEVDGSGSYGGGGGGGGGPSGVAGSLPRPPPELDDTELKLAEEEGFGAALGLGDLASLTVANEAMAGGEGGGASLDGQTAGADGSGAALRKTWTAKYTLRSHFDAIRDIAFHPNDQVLITASEDHTLKLWNLLSKTVQAKKSASFDVEPVYTFRGHAGPVLSLGVHPSGEEVYSGGIDGTVRVWHLINPNLDPYDAFDPSVHGPVLSGGHTDAVWSLAAHPTRSVLLSAGGDGCVLAWQPDAGGGSGGGGVESMLKSRITLQGGTVPTCLRFVSTDTSQYVVGTSAATALLMDVETNKQVLCMDAGAKADSVGGALHCQVNCVVTHPTLPLTIAGYEDRQIRFFDNHTGKLVHSMVAHLDAVTSLGIDPNGLYLLSGSHDCSIRLWHLDNKTCVQEITSHRKKFNESINSVAFHPSKPYIASAGADALAKVFV